MEFKYHSESCVSMPAGEHLIAMDLEMANSFVNEPPVICMVGIACYDNNTKMLNCTIASITSREQELKLISWFLQQLIAFKAKQPKACLLSFSGADNDIPWLEKRIDKYDLKSPQATILQQIDHLDLKREFKKRTQRDQISLKRLEQLFGIKRHDKLVSRKVSFMLTNVIKQKKETRISENIHRYLFQDVANLFHIYGRWQQVSLDDERLGEKEYLERLLSLARCTRQCFQGKHCSLSSSISQALKTFYQALQSSLEHAIVARSFASFVLPALPSLDPSLSVRHPIIKKLQSRYRVHKELPLHAQGKYWLQQDLNCPQGALAVVRNQARQILMIKRSDNLARAPGYWGLPGGVMETAELPSTCAQRELKEELNLAGHATAILGRSLSYSGKYNLFWMEIVLSNPTKNPIPNPKEVAKARWVSVNDLPTLEPLIPNTLAEMHRILGLRNLPKQKHQQKY